jgi:hypothetical protein
MVNFTRKEIIRILNSNKRTNLSGVDLRGVDLRGLDISSSNLKGAILSGMNLSNIDFSYSNLTKASLSNANLQLAKLNGAILESANLQGADLSRSVLAGVHMQYANLKNASLAHARGLTSGIHADLRDTNFQGANLEGIDLGYSRIHDADFRGAKLSDIKLRNVQGIKKAKWPDGFNPYAHGAGGCFIATASLGAACAPEVLTLCAFRDQKLRQTRWGQRLINLYENVSPPIAHIIAKHSLLRWLVRNLFIRPIAYLIRRSTPSSTIHHSR